MSEVTKWLDEQSSISVVDRIYKTSEYDLFDFIEGNRDVDKLGKLRKSIKKNGYMNYPIIVTLEDGKLKIADGQHRFTVCKEMSLPIYFILQDDFGIEKIQVANSAQKIWTTMDHIKSKSINSDDYARFRLLIEKFSFSPAVTYAATDGSLTGSSVDKIIKDGKLKCSNFQYERACKVLSWLSQFKADVSESNMKGSIPNLYCALIFAYNSKIVSVSKLAQRVHNNFFKYQRYIINVEDAIHKTEEAYNFNVQKENTIDLLSEYRKACKVATSKKKDSQKGKVMVEI